MSDSDNSVNHPDAEDAENVDLQMAFVILLEDSKILFDKRQTPAIKAEKDKAAKLLADAYNKNTKEKITVKQVMKKLNNMKTKVKEATDLKKTGNKKIVLTDWQKKFYAIWNNESVEGENPVLNKAPGAVTSGVASTSKTNTSSLLSPPEKKRKLQLTEIKEPEEFQGYSLQQLQRLCLIQQIKAALAQESAAIQMKEYYQLKTNVENPIILYTETDTETIADNYCKPYYKLKESIVIEAGIIFFENKIIVPDSLRLPFVKLLHKGHIGISKTVHKARKLFYWPELNTDISNYIKQCRVCEKYLPRNFKEPMLPHSIPSLRYNKIATDILEYAGKSYLVTVDYFSHWLELSPLKDKTSNSVINSFQENFTKFGYPQYLIADNLPFISNKCKNYYREKDIMIMTCTPEWHQSNGLAEKFVSIAKNILRKSSEKNTDFRELIMEYNNTEMIYVNASPAQILQSRSLRTQLPVTNKSLEPKIQTHIYKTLQNQQLKTKIQYDKTVRKFPTEFRKGDNVVIKSNRDKVWYKAVVLEKANEPRSYWIRKESNNKIVRRNTSQMKLSHTRIGINEYILDPELYPDTSQNVQNKNVSSENKPPSNLDNNLNIDMLPNNDQNVALHPRTSDGLTNRRVSSEHREDSLSPGRNNNTISYRSRYGRLINAPKRTNL